jgi:phosphomannomutase
MTTNYKYHFLFDVDGTLTPSRGRMDEEFKQFFIQFALRNPVYLVTGSDFEKTLNQVGHQITFRAAMVFNCSGNEFRHKGKVILRNEWTPPEDLIQEMMIMVEDSQFPIKTGNHIEYRTGSLNFSIVGRNANPEQREEYKKYDRITQERKALAKELSETWGYRIDFKIGGETGIDVYPKGFDKAQVLDTFGGLLLPDLVFFGDACEPDGNDYTLAQAVIQRGGKVHAVRSWKETKEILERDYL